MSWASGDHGAAQQARPLQPWGLIRSIVIIIITSLPNNKSHVCLSWFVNNLNVNFGSFSPVTLGGWLSRARSTFNCCIVLIWAKTTSLCPLVEGQYSRYCGAQAEHVHNTSTEGSVSPKCTIAKTRSTVYDPHTVCDRQMNLNLAIILRVRTKTTKYAEYS